MRRGWLFYTLCARGGYTSPMKLFQAFLAAVLTLTCVAASAQWQWVDKDGRRVFSDRAPPADILDKNIVKRPQGRGPNTKPAETASTDAESTPGATAPALAPAAPAVPKGAGVEKELEAKKKQAADAETAKRKAEEERITKAKVENCARAKQAKATYDSGIRVARTNAAGEREIMDDAARATEIKRIQGVINADCR